MTNGFNFNITGTTNIPVVLEACTNLASSIWMPLQACTLTNGSVSFNGLFLQAPENDAGGFFLGPTTSGFVTLEP